LGFVGNSPMDGNIDVQINKDIMNRIDKNYLKKRPPTTGSKRLHITCTEFFLNNATLYHGNPCKRLGLSYIIVVYIHIKLISQLWPSVL
jgi:hypothetical protein